VNDGLERIWKEVVVATGGTIVIKYLSIKRPLQILYFELSRVKKTSVRNTTRIWGV
jgi:hypothetical protein